MYNIYAFGNVKMQNSADIFT